MLTLPSPSLKSYPLHFLVFYSQKGHDVFAYNAQPAQWVITIRCPVHITDYKIAVLSIEPHTCLATNSLICPSYKLLRALLTMNATGNSPAWSSGYLYEQQLARFSFQWCHTEQIYDFSCSGVYTYGTTAASSISGCVWSRLSSSAGGTWIEKKLSREKPSRQVHNRGTAVVD